MLRELARAATLTAAGALAACSAGAEPPRAAAGTSPNLPSASETFVPPTPTRVQKTPEVTKNPEALLMERSKKVANSALHGDFATLIDNLDETVRHTFRINPQAEQSWVFRVGQTFADCHQVSVDENTKPSIEPGNRSDERWIVFPLSEVCKIRTSSTTFATRSQIIVMQRKDIEGNFQPFDVAIKAFGN